MKKKKIKEEKISWDMIYDLVVAIRDLKENECENSGLNWFSNFMDNFPQSK